MTINPVNVLEKQVREDSLKEQIPVLIVRDREGNTEEINKVISPLIEEDVLLCSDGSCIYKAFAKMHKLTHKIINASVGEHIKEGAYPYSECQCL